MFDGRGRDLNKAVGSSGKEQPLRIGPTTVDTSSGVRLIGKTTSCRLPASSPTIDPWTSADPKAERRDRVLASLEQDNDLGDFSNHRPQKSTVATVTIEPTAIRRVFDEPR